MMANKHVWVNDIAEKWMDGWIEKNIGSEISASVLALNKTISIESTFAACLM